MKSVFFTLVFFFFVNFSKGQVIVNPYAKLDSTCSPILVTSDKLGNIYSETGITYGQTDAEQATFKELASAKRKKERLKQLQRTLGHNKERQKQIDKLNKSSNDLTQSISQQKIAYEQANDVLIDTDGSIENLEKSFEKAAKQAKRIEISN